LATVDSSEVAGLTGRSESDWRRSALPLLHNPMGCQAVFISTVSRIPQGFSASRPRHCAGLSSRRT